MLTFSHGRTFKLLELSNEHFSVNFNINAYEFMESRVKYDTSCFHNILNKKVKEISENHAT